MSVLPAPDPGAVARTGFTVLLVAMLVFNSGTVTHLEGDRDVSMYSLEEVQIERSDIEAASFLTTHGTAPLKVFGGQYVKLKFRGGYALGDQSVRRQQVIDSQYKVIRFPFEDLEASAEGRGEGQTLMSVGPEAVLAEEPVGVVLDRTKIHLFDTDTGEAIVHGLE